MVRVRLKGINSIRKRLADGSAKTYWYAWKGGPPLVGAPGSPEFVRSYQEAYDTRTATGSDQLSSILDAYQDLEAFRSLAPSTARDYERYLTAIGREFGDFPLAGLGERGARVEFMRWRDNVAKRSRRLIMAGASWPASCHGRSTAASSRRTHARKVAGSIGRREPTTSGLTPTKLLSWLWQVRKCAWPLCWRFGQGSVRATSYASHGRPMTGLTFVSRNRRPAGA